MTEPKYTYRIPPCPAYDIPGMESWLEDMAAKGWHLCYDGFFAGFATFEQGAPRREIFRLEATATNGGMFSEEYAPEDDAIEMNGQMGWTYRARRGQFHIYSTSDPGAPELNTDPQAQAITIGALGKHLRGLLLHSLTLAAFYFWLHLSDSVLTLAIGIGTWNALLLTGLLLWGFLRDGVQIYRLSKLRQQLQSGEALPHRKDYARHSYRYLIFKLLRGAAWVFVIAAILIRMGSDLTEENAVSLTDYTAPLPFATLADLFPEGQVDTDYSGMIESEVTVWSDWLARNYDYTEYTDVTVDGDTITAFLQVNCHETCAPPVAMSLAKEFTAQAEGHFLERLFHNEFREAVPLDVPGADYAVSYYERYSTGPNVIVVKGSTVVRATISCYRWPEGTQAFTDSRFAEMVLAQIP